MTEQTVAVPFTVINGSIGPPVNFATLAGAPGAQITTGDFNKDGPTDIAFPAWSSNSSASAVVGQVNWN